MNRQRLKRQLTEIAERGIPDDLDLWPAMVRQLGSEAAAVRPNGAKRPSLHLVVIAAVAIFALGALSIPSVRGFSMELFNRFRTAASDLIGVEFITRDPSQAISPDESEFRRLGVEEASSRAGFAVKTPEFAPDGYELDHILAYEGVEQVILYYRDEGKAKGLIIEQYTPEAASEFVTACQQTVIRAQVDVTTEGQAQLRGEPEVFALAESEDCEALASVGNSAEIKQVKIGDATGEYVRGDWVVDESGPSPSAAEPGEAVVHDYAWNPDYPKHHLRWEDDGLIFEITAYDREMTLEDLLAIAESLN